MYFWVYKSSSQILYYKSFIIVIIRHNSIKLRTLFITKINNLELLKNIL